MISPSARGWASFGRLGGGIPRALCRFARSRGCARCGRARAAVESASAGKHQALNRARSLDHAGGDGLPLSETIEAAGRPDEDPVAKTLAREQLQGILDRARTLFPLERRCMTLSANGCDHREIAARLGVRPRAVNNALQRARRKVLGRGTG
jgi:DNA-directed RNA polymerase specialized sigma24 family protein